MARNKVTACNVALGHIGDRSITRLDSAAQEEDALVRYCADFFDVVLDELLERHRWSFAKADAHLTGVSAPLFRYTYAHQLPSDCQRLLEIHTGTSDGAAAPTFTYDAVPNKRFKIVGKTVQSNSEFLAAHYIKRVIDPVDWSANFYAAFGYLLASYLAGPVADDPQMEAKFRSMCESVIIPNAQYYDSVQDESGENDDSHIRKAESRFLASRGGNGAPYDNEDWDGYNFV